MGVKGRPGCSVHAGARVSNAPDGGTVCSVITAIYDVLAVKQKVEKHMLQRTLGRSSGGGGGGGVGRRKARRRWCHKKEGEGSSHLAV